MSRMITQRWILESKLKVISKFSCCVSDRSKLITQRWGSNIYADRIRQEMLFCIRLVLDDYSEVGSGLKS